MTVQGKSIPGVAPFVVPAIHARATEARIRATRRPNTQKRVRIFEDRQALKIPIAV
jgi:hypothetical protein